MIGKMYFKKQKRFFVVCLIVLLYSIELVILRRPLLSIPQWAYVTDNAVYWRCKMSKGDYTSDNCCILPALAKELSPVATL